jgi:hypothetical protein
MFNVYVCACMRKLQFMRQRAPAACRIAPGAPRGSRSSSRPAGGRVGVHGSPGEKERGEERVQVRCKGFP